MKKQCILLSFFLILLLQSIAIADDSLCARVSIEIQQEMTLERQAFDAHLRINNGLSNISIDNVQVDVFIKNEDNQTIMISDDPDNTDALFFIRQESLSQIDDIQGNGSVEPETSADIHWLIIPAVGASNGQEKGTFYGVGAQLHYTIGGESHDIDINPDYINVKPLPELQLDYFLPEDVIGDDAFTTEIEAPVPFSLGVMISNSGSGTARSLQLDTAQPDIVDNEQGLLIDFEIISSEVNGSPVMESLF